MSRGIGDAMNRYQQDIVDIITNGNSVELSEYLQELDEMILGGVLNSDIKHENGTVISLSEYCINISRSIAASNPELDPLAILIDQKLKLDLLYNYGADEEEVEKADEVYFKEIEITANQKPGYVDKMLREYDPETIEVLKERKVEQGMANPTATYPTKNSQDSGHSSPENAVTPPMAGKLQISENSAFKPVEKTDNNTVFL